MRIILQLGYVVLVILAGIFTNSIWVAVMVAGGFILLYSSKVEKTASYILRIIGGIGLTVGAIVLAKFTGRFVWPPIFLFAAFAIFIIGGAESHKAPKWRTPFQMAVGFLVVIFGVLSPYLGTEDLGSEGFLGWLLAMFLLIMIPFFIFVLRLSSQEQAAMKWAPRLAILIVLGVSVIAWFATKVIWVPFLIAIALFLGYRNYQRWIEGALFQYKSNLLEVAVGMVLIGVASFLAGLQPWWVWVALWVIISIPPLVIGSFLFDEEEQQQGMTMGGVIGLIMGVLGLILALIGPFMLWEMEIVPALITFGLIVGGALVLVLSWDGATTNSVLRALLLGILGTLLFCGASVYSDFAGGWVWVVLWLFGALLMVASIFSIRSGFGKAIFLLLTAFHLVAAIWGNRLVQRFISGEAVVVSSFSINWGTVLIIAGSVIGAVVLGIVIFIQVQKRKIRKSIKENPSPLGIDPNVLMSLLSEMEDKDKKKK